MQKTFLIVAGVLLSFSACIKEQLLFIPVPPSNSQAPTSYVDVFYSGDTTNGIAHALKNKVKWQGSGECNIVKNNNKNFWTLAFYTYADDLISTREGLAFAFIPDDCEGKTFVPKKYVNGEYAFTGLYLRAYSDGDLFIDRYKLDTTATDNYLHINRLDRIRKRMEGDFTISFNIVEPRRDPLNPKKVKFSSGRFGVKLPD